MCKMFPEYNGKPCFLYKSDNKLQQTDFKGNKNLAIERIQHSL